MATPSPASASRADSERFAETNFVVIGAGGLGCPALLGLLAAGARKIRIVDFDRVEASNLQRQVLFDLGDVGAPKAEAAARRLRARADDLDCVADDRRLRPAELPAFMDSLPPQSLVLEGSDDAELKFAINDACTARGVDLVLGGVVAWQGRAMAVGATGPCYRCFFEAPPPAAGIRRCADAGVMGAGAGIVGQLMSMLAVRCAQGGDVAGRLHVMDFRELAPRVLAPPARKDCPACTARPTRIARAASA